MQFFKAEDTISGQEGVAQAVINGEIHDLFFIKTLEASAEKEKAEIKTLGKRGTQHKTTGWTGTGSMTIYYSTSIFRQMILDYIKNGKDTYFDIIITNDDPNSSLGKQTVALRNCNIDSTVLAMIDVESEALEEDLDFTFDDVDILNQFNKPKNMQ